MLNDSTHCEHKALDAERRQNRNAELKAATLWLDGFDRAIPPVAYALNHEAEASRFYLFMKRAFDMVVALVALALLFPLLLLTALLIRLETPGPIFFTQKRVGRGLIFFNIYKFRTMHEHTPDTPLLVEDPVTGETRRPRVEEDPRLTKVGRILRVLSIDELPQLLNILWGEMSFIGPRPLTVDESLAIPTAAVCRYFVLPGLSGLAQLRDRAAVHGRSRFDSDIEYVSTRSFVLDLKLFFQSFSRFYHRH